MRPVVYTATATDVSNGYTQTVVVDYLRSNALYGLQYLTSGRTPGTGMVQYTIDDVFNLPYASLNWTNILMISGEALLNQVARGFRVQAPVLGDVFTVVTQGNVP
jgi:hypothetical protein